MHDNYCVDKVVDKTEIDNGLFIIKKMNQEYKCAYVASYLKARSVWVARK